MEHVSHEMIVLLRNEVEEKMGYKLRSPLDFSQLLLRMREVCPSSLSVSTVKRLWEYVPSQHIPRLYTLSLLTRFIGYKDWDDFCKKKSTFTTANSGFVSSSFGQMQPLSIGDRLSLAWSPNRRCLIECRGGDFFCVLESVNATLQPGDTFQANFFSLGHPLYVTRLVREGRLLQDYVAGKRNGLTEIRKVQDAHIVNDTDVK